MPKIQVHMEFDSIDEVRSFFGSTPVQGAPSTLTSLANPAQSLPAAPAAFTPTLVPSTAPASSTNVNAPTEASASSAPTASTDPAAIVARVKAAADALFKRKPDGSGAALMVATLKKHGYSRIRDVADPIKADAMIAELQAA